MKRSIRYLALLLTAVLLLTVPSLAFAANEAAPSNRMTSVSDSPVTGEAETRSEHTDVYSETETDAAAQQLPNAEDITFIYDVSDSLKDYEALRLTSWCKNVYEATGVAILYAVVNSADGKEHSEWCHDYINSLSLEQGTVVVLLDDLEQNTYMVKTLRLQYFDLEALMDAYQLGNYNCLDGVKGYMDEVVRQLNASGYDITQDEMIDFTAFERILPLVIDYTGNLSDEQVSELNARADSLTEAYACEVAFVMIKSLEGKTAQDWVDDFYDYNGYGYGDEDSGILLAISTGDREYADTTYGYGLTAFTDNGLYTMEDKVVAKLKQDDWSGAAYAYYDRIEELLEIAESGEPFDELTSQTVKYAPRAERLSFAVKYCFQPLSLIALLMLSAPVGVICSILKTTKMYKQESKTVFLRHSAAEYACDSFTLTRCENLYVNTTHSKVYKPQPRIDYSSDSDSSSSSSGRSGSYHGSSTHTSSSGRSHGGHSGKF